VSGSAVADVGGVAHHTNLTLVVKKASVLIAHHGTYRLNAEPAQLKVFEGRAAVQGANQAFAVGAGRALTWDATASPEKFDKRDTDALDTWSKNRSAFLARALYRQQNRNAQQLSTAASAAATTSSADPNPPLWEGPRPPSLVLLPPPNYFPANVSASFGCQAGQ
jgi:hypothetical protein